MLGPGCGLLLVAFSSTVVEGAIGVDGEVAAGRAPLDYDEPATNALTFTLVPGIGARLRGTDSTLTLSYTPRIFYRLPNALDVDRPLVLHQVALDHVAEVGPRLGWASSAQLSVGQIDYTAAGLVYDPSLSTGVRSSITDILRAVGQTGFKYELSRHTRLNLDASAEYTHTLDAAPTIVPNPTAPVAGLDPALQQAALPLVGVQPDSFQFSTTPTLSYAVGRNHRIGTSLDVTYQWFKQTARYLLLAPDISWDARVSARSTLSLAAGVAYVSTLEAALPQDDQNSWGGTGSVHFESLVYRGSGTSVTTAFNTSLEWFFDPISGTSQPRAGIEASSVVEMGRDWLFSPEISFYTLLRQTILRYGMIVDGVPVIDPTQPEIAKPDATLLRIELPLQYRITPDVSLAFGGRAALRGPALAASDFGFDQVEVWAFLGLTVRMASGEKGSDWLAF